MGTEVNANAAVDEAAQALPPGGGADSTAAMASALAELSGQLARLERSTAVDRVVAGSGALDHGAVLAAVQEALGSGGATLTPEQAMAKVRKARPGLFRQLASYTSHAAQAHDPTAVASTRGRAELDGLMAAAKAGNDRRALLRYLRAR